MSAPSPGDARPIGLLDSGVGGLSILRAIRARLPQEHLIFVADQAHVPYGPRSLAQVRAFTEGLVRFLLAQDCKLIVLACNTASAAALHPLRAAFPQVPFVGMEPAVKPAAHATRTGVIGVIATESTFQGELFASVVGRFAQGVRVETRACPAFVLLAEAGDVDSPAALQAVHRCLDPLLAAGIDQLVLGCTHFPFLTETIRAVVGPGVALVDPSDPVAQQVVRVLTSQAALTGVNSPGRTTCYTSGDPGAFRRVMGALLGESLAANADIRRANWSDDDSRLEPA